MKLLNKLFLLLVLMLGINTVYAEPCYTEDNTAFDVTFKQRNFTIKLKDISASTGIAWNKKPVFDEQIFELRNYQRYPSTSQVIGAPGSEEWKFHVPRSNFRTTQTVRIKFTTTGPAADSPSTTLVFNVTLKAKSNEE